MGGRFLAVAINRAPDRPSRSRMPIWAFVRNNCRIIEWWIGKNTKGGGSRDSAVGEGTVLWVERRRDVGSNPGGRKKFLCSRSCQDRNRFSPILLFNPLNPELNPICYLLALLGARHFLHVSRIRVKSLTLRRLILYVFYCYHILSYSLGSIFYQCIYGFISI